MPEKAEFIKKQGADKPVKDVIAAAKKQGMKLSENYIYKVRRDAGITNKKARGKQSAATGSDQSVQVNFGNAVATIAACPPKMPAGEVVARLRKEGLEVSIDQVEEVRRRVAELKAKDPETWARPGDPLFAGTKLGKQMALESSFKRMVSQLGVVRARELTDEVEKKLAEIFGAG
jgi:hypothetical protein